MDADKKNGGVTARSGTYREKNKENLAAYWKEYHDKNKGKSAAWLKA